MHIVLWIYSFYQPKCGMSGLDGLDNSCSPLSQYTKIARKSGISILSHLL